MELYYYTDYACPFCYIAQQHVAAFFQSTGRTMTPHYVEIHPEIPPQGCDRRLLLSDQQNEQMAAFLAELGAPYGLRPSLGQRLSNSEKALVLRAWGARYASEQLPFLDAAMYHAYCDTHLDIGREDVLQALLAEVGITEPMTSVLQDPWARSTYENDRFQAQKERIRAVPSFRIGAQLLTGLQTPEKLLEVYRQQLS